MDSYYDAVVRISENPMPELNEICTKMELRCFSERELSVLKEYCLGLGDIFFYIYDYCVN